MGLSSTQVLRWFTSPDELRELANAMEEDCKHSPAQGAVTRTISGDKIDLEICIDRKKCTEEGYLR